MAAVGGAFLEGMAGEVVDVLARAAVAVRWVAEHDGGRGAYVNDLAPSSPERIREVYGVNYPRLARVKAR